MSSKSLPSRYPAHSVPEDPLPLASTSISSQFHQAPRRRPSKMAKSGPLERHVKSSSVNHPSVSSHSQHDACSYYKPRTLWDTRDTFLPTAKPPPPLPKLEKPKRTPSQRQVKSPVGAAISTPIYRQPCATSSQSTSTEQSSFDLPVFDISREPFMEVPPRMRGALMRSTTQFTASSGTSDVDISRDPHVEVAPKVRGALMRSTTRITASSGTSDVDISREPRVEVAPKIRGTLMQSTTQITASSGTSDVDVSRVPRVEVAPKIRGGLMRSTTRITASSGTSDESVSRWKLPSRWAGPSADADKDSKPGAMSLFRFGSRKRAKSIPASSAHDAHPNKITLELL